jgi:cellulose synthase/poly-beta-1,6-N-acetylglucosamine synthase-like glycosyltransferase
VRFEQAYLASIVVWLINTVVNWDLQLSTIEANPAIGGNPQMLEIMKAVMVGFSGLSLLISLLLWYFTARKASNVTKWILVIFFILATIGIPFTVMGYELVGALSVGLSLVCYLLTAFAIFMLFRPDAKAWFEGETAAGPEIFE